MGTNLIDTVKYLPHIVICSDVVVEVSYAFVNLTQYNSDELIGCTYTDLLNKLRYVQCTSNSGFIFTKSLEAREVEIINHMSVINEKQICVFLEKPGSRLQDKFQVINNLSDDNNTSVAIYALPEAFILKANSIYCWYAGKYNESDIIGKKISDINDRWINSYLYDVFDNLSKTGKPYYIKEHEKKLSPNEVSYWSSIFIPAYEGKLLKYCVEISSNITETVNIRKSLENQTNFISSQNAELESIVNNMSDALVCLDKNGKFIMLNKSAKELGNEVDLNSKDLKLLDASDNVISNENSPLIKLKSGEKITHLTICLMQGDVKIYLDINATPVFDKNGDFSMAILSCRDITEQVYYKNKLKKQYMDLHNVIENLDLPIVRLSYPELDIIEINKKAYMHFCCADELNSAKFCSKSEIETHINDLISFSYGDKKNLIQQIGSTKSTIRIENIEFENGSGPRNYDILYQPIFDDYNNIAELLILATEITREVKQNKELQNTLKMQEEFFSFVSHDFKTPLTVINAAVQALQNLCGDELSDKALGFVKKIRQNSLRQLRLVNNLLDIIKASSNYLTVQKQNCDIVLVTKDITESVLLYANQKKLNLIFNSSMNSKIIGIDLEKYERVLLNLLSNAIKYTPSGKCIYVTVESVDDDIVIKVKDEGIGIPPEKHEVIFERFVQVESTLTRSTESTGIGLCLVKKLVQAMDGTLSLESKVGEGSTFTIKLPALTADDCNVIVTREKDTDDRLIKAVAIEFSDIYT